MYNSVYFICQKNLVDRFFFLFDLIQFFDSFFGQGRDRGRSATPGLTRPPRRAQTSLNTRLIPILQIFERRPTTKLNERVHRNSNGNNMFDRRMLTFLIIGALGTQRCPYPTPSTPTTPKYTPEGRSAVPQTRDSPTTIYI